MKAIVFLIAFTSSASYPSFSQSREAGTDLGEIKQYMRNKDTNTTAPLNKNTAAVRAVLQQYNSAIEKLDMTGTDNLFTNDSEIYESGLSEGNYTNFMNKHLKPELKELKSFKFNNHNTDVTIIGNHAFATETYSCITVGAKHNTEVKRKGVTTSVLKKQKGEWKIMNYHNSSTE